MTRRHGRPPHPAPEVVDGGTWEIEEIPEARDSSVWLRAGTNPGGLLRTAFGGAERERYVRNHEYGHIRWSPRGPSPGHVPESTLQHTEDARIGRRLEAVGILPTVRMLSDEELLDAPARLRAGQRLNVASLLFALHGTQDGEFLTAAVAEVNPRLPPAVERIWRRTIGADAKPEFERAVDAAEQLVRRFGSLRERLALRLPGLAHSRRAADGPAGLGGVCVLATAGTAGSLRVSAEGRDAHPGWGRLDVVEPPRPLPLSPRLAGRGRRAAESGERLGDVSRFFRDGRGWRSRRGRRHVGGCVLIDCSGSMTLTAETLEELVAANPVALIATYSGDSGRERGRLHVVARHGRRVRPEDVRPPGMHNVVDGPALEWLGTRPGDGPRVWVSDGAVTGVGERRTDALVEEADALMRRYGIRRVETADALLGEWRGADALPR